MKLRNIICVLIFILSGFYGFAQTEAYQEGNPDNLPVREYELVIEQQDVNKAGKTVQGMTVNGQIPGPIIRFTEGEYAVINVTNKMDVETSIHWHGILLPNFYDGVPYLTTPPIKPGETFKYEFAIKQNGTYWYHSHTMLQEQSGVFGSIVIDPVEKDFEYDSDLVLMLSDWTNEKPRDVQRTLKRGTEWYNIKKGTATPLNRVISRGAFGAQLNFWKQRMEGADIADIYYPAFLINGEEKIEYPQFKPGEKVRLRIIDGSASTSFWMTFGGETPMLIAADGKNVVPIKNDKTFIGVAEVYDFLVTIPDSGKIEFRIMSQDGSGTASAFLGEGEILPALQIPKPDKIAMMQKMAKMDMKMGAPALKANPKKDERFKLQEKYGMHMDMEMKDGEINMMNGDMKNMDHSKMDHSKMDSTSAKNDMKMNMPKDSVMTDHSKIDHSAMLMKDTVQKPFSINMDGDMPKMKMDDPKMDGMEMFDEYNYDYLRSPVKTKYDENVPVNEILLNLTGNMQRYVWSLNGVPLSESDKIKIKSNEVTRITFNNLTMMHHPMHLHGHFFRVINENGEYSPLKHTVNVPPMKKMTIEFYGNKYGNWFFHCHILYHMMGGMARIVSYDTPRDERLKGFPVSNLLDETDMFYTWGRLDAASHMAGLNVVSSNIRNEFMVNAEYGWNKNLEAEATYGYYINDWVRVFGGVNVENGMEDSLDELETTAIAGIRYFTPYMFDLDLRMDSKLRPQISLGREIMIFPRLSIFADYEFQADFGWVNDLPDNSKFENEQTITVGAEYFLSKNFSLMGSYDNRFGAGGGLSVRF